jgi:hypothetical protein
MSTLTAAQAATIIRATRRMVSLEKARARTEPLKFPGQAPKRTYARTSTRVSGLEPSSLNPRHW